MNASLQHCLTLLFNAKVNKRQIQAFVPIAHVAALKMEGGPHNLDPTPLLQSGWVLARAAVCSAWQGAAESVAPLIPDPLAAHSLKYLYIEHYMLYPTCTKFSDPQDRTERTALLTCQP